MLIGGISKLSKDCGRQIIRTDIKKKSQDRSPKIPFFCGAACFACYQEVGVKTSVWDKRMIILIMCLFERNLNSLHVRPRQWRAVTSETGHAVRMQKLVMQLTCNTL